MVAELLLGFGAGVAIAVLTAPVGVSGAVFLLPVQLSVLGVANPAVTPTNLLYNVIAAPGALLRYRRRSRLLSPLTRLLVLGTVPGVVLGALVRVYLLPGPDAFRLVAGLVLLVLGGWLVLRTLRPSTRNRAGRPVPRRAVVGSALVVGLVGGVYGVGGGSILSPLLVGSGMAVGVVAPAALASTFITSVVGAVVFVVLARVTPGPVGPDWAVGIACGLGGLLGGYLGARLQPHLPEHALRLLLGALAAAIGALYVVQGLAGGGTAPLSP